jgi:hypothetical protein
LKLDRLSPDNPIRVIRRDGFLLEGADATTDRRHFDELRSYVNSMQPARQVGRPKGQPKTGGRTRRLTTPEQDREIRSWAESGLSRKETALRMGWTGIPSSTQRSRVNDAIERAKLADQRAGR